ncbi:MAG: lysoplasmalogenase [Acidobacteria bacterium]|nr:lysoplasmalogenase [Acidobacteriota bacterium]
MTGLAVLGLVSIGNRRAFVTLKPAASVGFIAVALSAGALDSSYGRWILAGLVLGAVGDVALLSTQDTPFLVGLSAFLLGHLAYVIALTPSALDGDVLAIVAGVAVSAAVGLLAWRWIRPGVDGALRPPVIAYVTVISVMLAAALASAGARTLATLGAVLFTASDLGVARERFLVPSAWNARIGLPLYYAGQLLFAWSVGG